MKTYLSSLAVAATLTGGLAISACASTASQSDVAAQAPPTSSAEAAPSREASVDQAAQDALAHEAAKHPFVRTVLMKDNSITFESNKSDLSPQAQAALTSMADRLKAENKNVYIEIQGHGDAAGSAAHNKQLGQMRAEAVRAFLSKQGVPLDRMSTISYGEEQLKNRAQSAAADAENRRVVLIVMG